MWLGFFVTIFVLELFPTCFEKWLKDKNSLVALLNWQDYNTPKGKIVQLHKASWQEHSKNI